MYSGLPTRQRRAIKIALTTAWLLSTGAGLSAVADPRVTVVGLGDIGTMIAGATLLVATGVAAGGVALARYRWEWIASWLAASALTPYVVTLWAFMLVSGSNSGQTFLVTSLLAFYVGRALQCAAHAAKLREVHSAATAAIDSVTEGDRDGDARAGDDE
jgi:hypothetical protein